jgi:hypothetical protein
MLSRAPEGWNKSQVWVCTIKEFILPILAVRVMITDMLCGIYTIDRKSVV